MKGPRYTVSRITQPVKTLVYRFAFIALFLAAVALIVLGRVDKVMVEQTRTRVIDVVAPILYALSQPFVTVNRIISEGRKILAVKTENEILRGDRARLFQWQSVARKLEVENRMLKGLLNFKLGPGVSFISGRVVADTGGAFVHSMILNAGTKSGVSKGQAVVTGDGLLGRIASVGRRAARVLLITDLNSRIPVVLESSRVRAIMVGTNDERPRLTRLSTGMVISKGDRVVTSGHGGVFPRGLPIGIVSSVSGGIIEVRPFVDRDRVEFVRVIDYGLNGIIQDINPAGTAQKRN